MSEPITSLPVANTIDPTQDVFPIVTNSINTTQQINRNTFLGLASAPVGLTDTQNVTNKTFNNTNSLTVKDGSLTLQNTSSTTKQAQFSLASITAGNTRTYTVPDYNGTLATLAGVETLTNKTLTSPTINSPTITNATLSADTISGYTTSNTGTIYGGISVSTGNVSLSGNLAVTGTTSLTGKLTTSAFIVGTPPVWQYLGYAQITSNFATSGASLTAITGLSVTVTVPTGVTKVRVTVGVQSLACDAAAGGFLSIWSGTVGSGTELADVQNYMASTSVGYPIGPAIAIYSPSPGSITYNAARATSTGNPTVGASATSPAFILVECC